MYLEWSLSKAREYLGADDPQTKLMLGKESPEDLARRLVAGTRLADPKVRLALWEGGKKAILASKDPLIVYARKIDANARAIDKQYDALVDAPITAAQAKLADARFAAYGDTIYPDATFTLRISYGRVLGWIERGKQVPTRTTLGGTYERATGAYPFDLAPAFVKNRSKIDMATTYDFVTTNDIIGGNSGSPVVDRQGAVIGAAFDGNIHSLGGNYGYDPDAQPHHRGLDRRGRGSVEAHLSGARPARRAPRKLGVRPGPWPWPCPHWPAAVLRGAAAA